MRTEVGHYFICNDNRGVIGRFDPEYELRKNTNYYNLTEYLLKANTDLKLKPHGNG